MEIRKPSLERMIKRAEFYGDARLVAGKILGGTILRKYGDDEILARITEVSVWDADGLRYAPGTISVGSEFGARIDIYAGSSEKPGYMTLIGIETPNGRILGSGSIVDYLKINRELDNSSIEGPRFWIGRKSSFFGVKRRELPDLPKNCRGYFYI